MSLSRSELQLARGRILPLFLRYAMPGVFAMLFLAFQTIIDGFIVGRLIGADALAAVNIAMPVYAIVSTVAVVLGVGTEAQIGLHLGKVDYIGAKRALCSGTLGVAFFTIIGTLIINLLAYPIVSFLGADKELIAYSVAYVHGVMPWLCGVTLLFFLDYQLKALGQPRVAMAFMISTMMMNILLSLLFVGYYHMGTFGAGLGTGISFTIGSIAYLIYFIRTLRVNKGLMQAGNSFSFRTLWHIFYNGSSEGFTELAVAIVTFLFNITFMEYAGKNGVAAFTLINNLLFFGISISLGVSNGIIPIISYNHGAKQYMRVAKVNKLAIKTNFFCGIFFMMLLCLFSEQIIEIFIDSSEVDVINMASHGAKLVSLVFLFNGFNIFAASYFTAIDRPDLSLLVASLRGLIFLVAGIMLLPGFFGVNGIWISTPIAEFATAILTIFILMRIKKKYLP